MVTNDEATAFVLGRCRELGFALAGVCPAEPSRRAAELRSWLEAGRHGEMAYLARNVEVRLDPARLLPGVRSILCVADRHDDAAPDPPAAPGFGRIARYARGDDYHRIIKRRLHELADDLAARFPRERFRACVDTAPLLEREHAERAGLGAVGKHTLLIERGVGSYLLLGALLTTLELAPSGPAAPDPCGDCTRCIDACPTGAIAPWTVDATRCISYLTIEHRGRIEPELHEPIGHWLFGCDVCQEVCPHNQPTDRTGAAARHPAYAPRRRGFDLLAVLGWTEDDRREAFRRSALKRAKLAMIRRNAAIAAGNALADADLPGLLERLERIAGDPEEDPTVRDAAATALRRP
ncbi:MAG: tRNA epoxyqueuosine(34) reductase QueG [Planctomycetota bacterium]|jgi:epoxyqueuosine reductase